MESFWTVTGIVESDKKIHVKNAQKYCRKVYKNIANSPGRKKRAEKL